MVKKKTTTASLLHVPIYGVEVWIVVGRDISALRKNPRWAKEFGEFDSDVYGLCCWDGSGLFGVFLDREYVNMNLIAHEVFHLTHRILDFIGAEFDADHDEQSAHLHGWLMDKVVGEVVR